MSVPGLQVLHGCFALIQLLCAYLAIHLHRRARPSSPTCILLALFAIQQCFGDITILLGPFLDNSHTGHQVLRYLTSSVTFLGALIQPMLIVIAYELCHIIHGGPKRALLSRDQFGRIAAVGLTVCFVAYQVIDFALYSKVMEKMSLQRPWGMPVFEINNEGRWAASELTKWVASVILVGTGGCLWARTRYPWLALLQVAVILGRAILSSGPPEPTQLLLDPVWAVIFTLSITMAHYHVINCHMDEPYHDDDGYFGSGHSVFDPLLPAIVSPCVGGVTVPPEAWTRWYGAVEIWENGQRILGPPPLAKGKYSAAASKSEIPPPVDQSTEDRHDRCSGSHGKPQVPRDDSNVTITASPDHIIPTI
ncbi:hypothetical protein DFS34DRAFT_286646 [Phlyctochytrium arcticum]|nr:hypothetical protein DFS34DRAFT_286646 [Phlyctochytrium arcticum]